MRSGSIRVRGFGAEKNEYTVLKCPKHRPANGVLATLDDETIACTDFSTHALKSNAGECYEHEDQLILRSIFIRSVTRGAQP